MNFTLGNRNHFVRRQTIRLFIYISGIMIINYGTNKSDQKSIQNVRVDVIKTQQSQIKCLMSRFSWKCLSFSVLYRFRAAYCLAFFCGNAIVRHSQRFRFLFWRRWAIHKMWWARRKTDKRNKHKLNERNEENE